VVNCEALRRHLIEDENVAPDTVHVCYNGLDTRSFRPDGKSIPVSLADADLVIGTLCVLRPEKGLDTLLRAFSSLRSRHPGARLLIVGSGPMLEPMRNVCKELGITEQTVFQPATADVPYWIRAMDVFVLPSLSEALSNSLMEAMACGVASIASEVGGSPELIRNGETGFLFRAGDVANLRAQLERLASDAELRRRIAAAGSEFIIENFSIKAAVQRFDDLYVQLRDATSQ
jgi:glycosyltransferase involved in cell wall biosynthesis